MKRVYYFLRNKTLYGPKVTVDIFLHTKHMGIGIQWYDIGQFGHIDIAILFIHISIWITLFRKKDEEDE